MENIPNSERSFLAPDHEGDAWNDKNKERDQYKENLKRQRANLDIENKTSGETKETNENGPKPGSTEWFNDLRKKLNIDDKKK